MNQNNENVSYCPGGNDNNGFLIIVVLYILLAIILGSRYRNYY